MERFLTRRARPFWIVRVAEASVMVVLAFWTAVALSVMFSLIWPLSAGDVIAALLLIGLPVACMVAMTIRLFMRACAVRIASVLSMADTDKVSWELIAQHAHIRNVEKTLWLLYRHKYLKNINIRLKQVEILRKEERGQSKCAMCGAALVINRSGSLCCPYCGTRPEKR